MKIKTFVLPTEAQKGHKMQNDEVKIKTLKTKSENDKIKNKTKTEKQDDEVKIKTLKIKKLKTKTEK